jgi:uncharacterized protein YjiS (DUF1127 family)
LHQTILQPLDTKEEHEELSNLIPEIERWFTQMERTDSNLSQIDFSEQQIADLNRLKNEKFTDITKST